MICTQIVMLPYQQQITLKKLLETSVPDIDSLVLTASRSEWSSSIGNKSTASSSMMMMMTSSQPSMPSIQAHSMEPHSTSSSSPPPSSSSPPLSSSSMMKKMSSPVKKEEEEEEDRIIIHTMLSYPNSSPPDNNHRATIIDKHPSMFSTANQVDLSTTARSNVSNDNATINYYEQQHPKSTYRDITSYDDVYNCLSPRHSHISVSKDVDGDYGVDAISSINAVGKQSSPIHNSFISNYESIKSGILSSSPYSYHHQPTSASSISSSSQSNHQPINNNVSLSPTHSRATDLTSSSLSNYQTNINIISSSSTATAPSIYPAIQNTISSSSSLSSASLYPTTSQQSNFTFSNSTLLNKVNVTDRSYEQQQYPLVSTTAAAVDRKPYSSPTVKTTASEDNQVWLLESLYPASNSVEMRQVASKELKALIKTASDNYWVRNYAQVTAGTILPCML